MDLVEASSTGDQLQALRAGRDWLASQIQDPNVTNQAAKAAFMARWMEALAQIATLERLVPAAEGSTVDEVSRRRAERSAAVRARA